MISLIGVGLLLLIIEIIFVPGTTFVGVVGFGFLAVGVAMSFNYFGEDIGWITLGGSAVLTGVMLYFSFRTNVWSRFALKSSIDSKVDEGQLNLLTPGLEGIALSALRPVGKAEIGSQALEVKTLGEYVDSGQKVRIIKIESNQVFVEPIN